MLCPRISASPASGCSSPAIIRSVVVFPAPFAPKNANNSPCATLKESCCTAGFVPKRLERFRSCNAGTVVMGWLYTP